MEMVESTPTAESTTTATNYSQLRPHSSKEERHPEEANDAHAQSADSSPSPPATTNGSAPSLQVQNGTDVVSLVDKFVAAAAADPVRVRRLIVSLQDSQQRLLGSIVHPTTSPSNTVLAGSGDSWLHDENSQLPVFSSSIGQDFLLQSQSSATNISTSLVSVASSAGGSNEGSNDQPKGSSTSTVASNSHSASSQSNFLTAAKMSRLEAEKNDLLMQVSVLSAQVSAQQEKISELETNASVHAINGNAKKHLNGTNGTNGNGVTAASSLASINDGSNGIISQNGTLSSGSAQHRLDLLSEISTLKVRLAASENAARDWEAKYSALQKMSTQQQYQIKERDLQLADLRNRLVRQQQQAVPPEAMYEIDRLRRAVDSLLTSNVDKDRKVEELQAQMIRYRKIFDNTVEEFSDTASAKSLNIGRYMTNGNGSVSHQQSQVMAQSQQMMGQHPQQQQQQQPQQAVVAPLYSRPNVGGGYAPIGDSSSLAGNEYTSATYPYPSRSSSRAANSVGDPYSVAPTNGTSRPPSVIRQGPIPPMSESHLVRPYDQSHSHQQLDHRQSTQVVAPLVMHQSAAMNAAPSAEDDSCGELNDVVYDDVASAGLHNQRNASINRSLRVPRVEEASYWSQQPHYSTSSVADTVFDENLPSIRPKKAAPSGRPSPNVVDEEQRRVDDAVSEYKQRLDRRSNQQLAQEHTASSIAKSATSKFASGLSRFLGLGSSKKSNNPRSSQTVDAEEIGIYGSSDGPAAFVRGGVRATVATTGTVPRRYVAPTFPTGHNGQQSSSVPPRLWDTEQIVRWLADLGLQQYIPECRRSIYSGERLLQMTSSELEKELGAKNQLHVKKLQIAISRLRAISSGSNDVEHPSSRLHSALVLRWLDDIGLPQYKDVFVECQIDGAVLHVLSVDDLAQLHITSRLHALSIRWGITALRAANFDLNRFIRRPPLSDGSDRVGSYTASNGNGLANGDDSNVQLEPPSRVLFWTCHRVMDWLRSVDLGEYAVNVRGSGLHGALMLLESTFTAESLAAILQIPSNRSLLRRHLAQQFEKLVGQAAAEAKSATGQSEVLLPSTKLKVKKSRSGSGIFGSSSTKQVSANPPLTIDVFAGSSNSSLNASLLSSPSVDGKILSSLVGTSSGSSSKRNSPRANMLEKTDSNGALNNGGNSNASLMSSNANGVTQAAAGAAANGSSLTDSASTNESSSIAAF